MIKKFSDFINENQQLNEGKFSSADLEVIYDLYIDLSQDIDDDDPKKLSEKDVKKILNKQSKQWFDDFFDSFQDEEVDDAEKEYWEMLEDIFKGHTDQSV